jgi:hypothetical protein
MLTGDDAERDGNVQAFDSAAAGDAPFLKIDAMRIRFWGRCRHRGEAGAAAVIFELFKLAVAGVFDRARLMFLGGMGGLWRKIGV